MAQLDLDSREAEILESPPLDTKTALDPSPAYPFAEDAAKKPVKRRFRHWFWIALLLYFLLISIRIQRQSMIRGKRFCRSKAAVFHLFRA